MVPLPSFILRGLQDAVAGAERLANKGVASGYAPLDSNARVPSVHLPASVDSPGLAEQTQALADEIARAEAAEAALVSAAAVGTPSGVASLDAGGKVPAAQMRAYNDRGQIAYSTTYNIWDTVLYKGMRIVFTGTVTTGSGTLNNGEPFVSASNYVKLSSFGVYYAADYGVTANGVTDDWVAMQNLLLLLRSQVINSFMGFRVILPTGSVLIGRTLIIPSHIMLQGQGIYSTNIKIATNANCDVVQTEQFNSAAQAAILTTGNGLSYAPGQAALRNAFRWGLVDLTVHGNAGNQSPTVYKHGVNVQTNPLTSVGTGDPDFDPALMLRNVQFRSCTGDGFFANGRSGARLEKCIAWFNRGNGFTPSFDTQMDHCQAGFNGCAGFYMNHASNQGAGNKSYNNGQATWWWTSGTTYAAGQYAYTATGLYYTAAGVTNSTTDPASDTANWTVVPGTSSPKAWGTGVYMDSNCSEITFNCDCQQASASSWVVRTIGAGTGSGIHISGVSSQPNFGGGNQSVAANNTTNPQSYAHLVLDNASGVNVDLGFNNVATATYVLRLINGSTRNHVTMAGDTTGTMFSADTPALVGTGNSVSINGKSYTNTLSGQNDVALASPQDGQTLTYNGTTGKWVNSSLGVSSFAANLFGDGTDGAVVLDGTSTVAGFTRSGTTYTQTRNIHATTFVINAGVTVIPSAFFTLCTVSWTNNGTVSHVGAAGAANGTAGVLTTNGAMVGGSNGGVGNVGAGAAGNSSYATPSGSAGAGGAGASGAAGAGGSAPALTANGQRWLFKNPDVVQTGLMGLFGIKQIGGGPGGGGGGGDGVNKGGGGGGGGGNVVVFARLATNNGTINVAGGAGGTPTVGNAGGGGGGAGGWVGIYTQQTWTNTGTVTLTGGAAGAGVGTGGAGVAGGAGYFENYMLS